MKWLVGRFKYAFEGLRYAFKDRSIAFQCFLGVLAFLAGIIFQCSMTEWLWILLSIVLVVSFEIINSCIEGLVDYISLKRDPRAKNKERSKGKENQRYGSGCGFFSELFCACCGTLYLCA